MGHHQTECLLVVHFHVNELLDVEAQHVVMETVSVPVDEHGLAVRIVCEVLHHSGIWDVKEVTGRLDGLLDFVVCQPEAAESPAQREKLIHGGALVELLVQWTVEEIRCTYNHNTIICHPSSSHSASF